MAVDVDKVVEHFQAHKVVIGKDSSGDPVYVRVTDDGYLIAKLMAKDTETTDDDVQVACDASGRLYGAYEGDLTVSMGDVEKLLAGHYWKDQRFAYSSGKLQYRGLSTTHKASTSSGNLWWIWKYTYSGNDCTRIEGPLNDDWDDRASLSWA